MALAKRDLELVAIDKLFDQSRRLAASGDLKRLVALDVYEIFAKGISPGGGAEPVATRIVEEFNRH